jgi:DUF1365 family protein
MHHRLEPKKHSFHYNVFMFYLDLDEIDGLSRSLRWMEPQQIQPVQLPR